MNNLHNEAGIVLELIQKWEQSFKEFTITNNIQESDDKRSLSNMASFLLRNKVVNEYEYTCIKKVIEVRNYVIHRLFIDDSENKINKIRIMKDTINVVLDISYSCLLHILKNINRANIIQKDNMFSIWQYSS